MDNFLLDNIKSHILHPKSENKEVARFKEMKINTFHWTFGLTFHVT